MEWLGAGHRRPRQRCLHRPRARVLDFLPGTPARDAGGTDAGHRCDGRVRLAPWLHRQAARHDRRPWVPRRLARGRLRRPGGKDLRVHQGGRHRHVAGLVRPRKTADAKSAGADSTGFDGLLAESQRAWADRWQSDIVLPDDPTLQRQIREAQFYLQESIRPGTDWSISPVGLSSSGYNDHVFWDAETWMYPSLLLLHPDVASSVVNYRANTIAGARANAQATGYR